MPLSDTLPGKSERQIYIQWKKNTIRDSVDLFCFGTGGIQSLDSYQRVATDGEDPVHALATAGSRRLVALGGSPQGRDAWYGIRTYADLCKHRFSLQEDSPYHPLTFGQVWLADNPVREFSLEMKPMLCRVRLRSVSADFSRQAYRGIPFTSTLLYLAYAGVECKPLEWSTRPTPLSWLNGGAPDSTAVLQLPYPDMLLQEGLGDIGPERMYPQRDFYCYPGPQLRLVLAGRVGTDECYYPVPLPDLQPGNTYELQLTLTRKGAPDPDQPVQAGTVVLENVTVPWELAQAQHIAF